MENNQLRQPVGIPGKEDVSSLISKGGKFKIKVLDSDGKTVGYVKYENSSPYNHYAQVQSSGDTFEIMQEGRREYWKIISGVSAGYFMTSTINGWLTSSNLSLARTFYLESGIIWEEKSAQPLSSKGSPSVGEFIAVWASSGYNALQVELESVNVKTPETA